MVTEKREVIVIPYSINLSRQEALYVLHYTGPSNGSVRTFDIVCKTFLFFIRGQK